MTNDITKTALNAMKITLAVGAAAVLLSPYRVEKIGESETKYHAPLYKLSYKSSDSTKNGKPQKVHTFTVSGFGLISDQLITLKRLYKATSLRTPYMKERAQKKIEQTADKLVNTAIDVTNKAKKAATDVETKLCAAQEKFYQSIENILE